MSVLESDLVSRTAAADPPKTSRITTAIRATRLRGSVVPAVVVDAPRRCPQRLQKLAVSGLNVWHRAQVTESPPGYRTSTLVRGSYWSVGCRGVRLDGPIGGLVQAPGWQHASTDH